MSESRTSWIVFDLALIAFIGLFVGGFLWAGSGGGDNAVTPDILRFRATGTCALVALAVALAIGPLARLEPRLAPLSARRSHLVVAVCVLAAIHAVQVLNWYHDIGALNPLVALLADNTRMSSLTGFPFELLGVAALALLLIPATTGWPIWQTVIGPARWRWVQGLVYPAFALALTHVALGTLQSERSVLLAGFVVAGFIVIAALEAAAGWRGYRDSARTTGDGYEHFVAKPLHMMQLGGIGLAGALVFVAGLSLATAAAHRDPGPGGWGDYITVTGVLKVAPYPLIEAGTRSDGRQGSVLLVDEGKFGAQREAQSLDGKTVEARGYALYRGNATVLQLAEALKPLVQPVAAAVPPTNLGRHHLRGEIVDAKCFVGAMKPGDGKAHKDCATLCILGGIPPLLLTRDDAGTETLFLLADPHGGPVTDTVLPYVGEPVELDADIERRGDLNLARIDPASLRPLAP
jgi:DMSO/TMAO reductase YedYZ heme-binding membrane subunit